MKQSELWNTLSDLIRINSVNPAYADGRPERTIQEYVFRFFSSHAIPVFWQEVLPDRSNVIGKLPGRNPDRRLVFEAHSDTAGIEGMVIPPFEPNVSGGRMYGRGSCDTKAGLAAMMHALADIKRFGKVPTCEVWVVAAVDEEFAYRGVLKLRQGLQAGAAVVAEPTEMKMTAASKGCLRWRITVTGKSAHSSKPDLGVNAIHQMARVLFALQKEEAHLQSIHHALVGSPTFNVGRIEGGTQVNIVPEKCWIEVDRRLIPGEDPAAVLRSHEDLLQTLRNSNGNLEVNMEPPLIQDCPLETPLDSEIVLRTAHVLRGIGIDDRPVGVSFGSDASKLAQIGIPSIILGPGSIDHAHTPDEYVELDQVEQAFLAYRELMRVFE